MLHFTPETLLVNKRTKALQARNRYNKTIDCTYDGFLLYKQYKNTKSMGNA